MEIWLKALNQELKGSVSNIFDWVQFKGNDKEEAKISVNLRI